MKDRYLFKAKQKNWRKLPKEQWWITGYYVLGFNEYEEPIHMFFEPTSMFYSHKKTDGWEEAGFYFNVLLEDGRFEEEYVYDYQDCMEIVGNTFDNMELLERGIE